MCRTQCLLAFVALTINFAYSWDIALTFGDQLQFYGNGTKTSSSKGDSRFRDLTALAYDAVSNILLFVDKQNDNASIFSYNLTSEKFTPLVKRKLFENIQGVAFDPVTGLLFWVDSQERSIYWKPLRSTEKDNFYGRLLLKMDDEIPRAIAVDSCRGYIYWTNINFTKPTIERAKFDGSDRKIIVGSGLYSPVSIAIDQRTNTLLWADDKEGIHYSIDSSDLNGQNLKNLVSGIHHQPNSIAVSKDSIFWVDFGFKSVWKIPKVPKKDTEPVALAQFSSEMPFAVVANYNIGDQTEGVAECKKLAELSKNATGMDEVTSIPSDAGVYCLHGVATAGQACKCTLGYKGERCEISVCQNYCFEGDCSVTAEGEPLCRCKTGYTGSKCEVGICRNQCLNGGRCSVVGEKPECSCPEEFEGARCESSKAKQDIRNCTQENCTTHPISVLENLNDGEFVQPSCVDGWDPIRDPVIMVLGVISGLLCVACAVLITKIMKLKKRPRIKKRIIVNKNVTPLTARPDQCEITIENCCNMNICETPCFEPRSTIRPKLLDAKPGKEEKKNLIANMEYPDDY